MLVGGGVSAVGAYEQGQQQKKMYAAQATMAENDAAYKEDAAKAQAEKIRRIAAAQRGETKAALAKSGVDLGEGTPLELDRTITQRSEQDSLSAILTGSRASKAGADEASMLNTAGSNAETQSYFKAGATALQAGGTYYRGGWKAKAGE